MNQKGQAILEYLLLVVMLAVTLAVIIRNTNRTIYGVWTGLARQVASPCVDCQTKPAPPP
jgi:Flp pilus assembly pilin Flp